MDEEGMQETDNNLIYIGKPIEMNDDEFEEQIQRLKAASYSESDDMKEIVAEIVPTYHPGSHDDRAVTASTEKQGTDAK